MSSMALVIFMVDRTAPILPWQSEEVPPGERLSPVQASAGYLAWLRRSWSRRFCWPVGSSRWR